MGVCVCVLLSFKLVRWTGLPATWQKNVEEGRNPARCRYDSTRDGPRAPRELSRPEKGFGVRRQLVWFFFVDDKRGACLASKETLITPGLSQTKLARMNLCSLFENKHTFKQPYKQPSISHHPIRANVADRPPSRSDP